jgi:uncharacterized protein with PQ loop repeat
VHGFAIATGYIGAALSLGMVIPQLVRTLRHRGLGGVSAMSWLITAAACFTWLLYGVKGHVWPQVPGNALMIPGEVVIVLVTPARLNMVRRAGLLAATGGTLILVAVLIPTDYLGYLAFAFSLVASAPQVVTSLLRRGAGRSAVSIPAWLLRGGSQLFWLYYGLIMHNGPIVVAAVVTLVSAAAVIATESATRLGRRPAAAPLPQAGDPA